MACREQALVGRRGGHAWQEALRRRPLALELLFWQATCPGGTVWGAGLSSRFAVARYPPAWLLSSASLLQVGNPRLLRRGFQSRRLYRRRAEQRSCVLSSVCCRLSQKMHGKQHRGRGGVGWDGGRTSSSSWAAALSRCRNMPCAWRSVLSTTSTASHRQRICGFGALLGHAFLSPWSVRCEARIEGQSQRGCGPLARK